MSVSVASQLTALLGAFALGLGVGLLYDLLRCLRWRSSGPIRRTLSDLLFWLCTTAALFFWSIRACGGLVHFSICAALFLGAAAYLRALSPLCLPALHGLLGLFSSFLHLIGAPFRLFCRIVGKSINFLEIFFKKHFSFSTE